MTLDELWKETDRRAQELFGDPDGRKLANAELDIIFSTATHAEKVASLKVLRGAKA